MDGIRGVQIFNLNRKSIQIDSDGFVWFDFFLYIGSIAILFFKKPITRLNLTKLTRSCILICI